MVILTPPYGLNPTPKSHGFHTFGKGFHRHHNHAFSFSQSHIGVNKKIFKYQIHFHYMAILTSPRGHGFHNLGRSLPEH